MPSSRLSLFYDAAAIVKAFEKYKWTPDEEIQRLVAIARSAKSPMAQMQAMRTLRNIAHDTLVLAGAIERLRGVLTAPAAPDNDDETLPPPPPPPPKLPTPCVHKPPEEGVEDNEQAAEPIGVAADD